MESVSFRTTKAGKKELLRLSRVAHERALRAALATLESKFGLWRAGTLDSFELNDAIHEYHQGEQREIWFLYERNMASIAVARAVAEGLLAEAELSPALLEDLGPGIAYFRAR